MQSEHSNAASRNLRIVPRPHTHLRGMQHAKPDTRRWATIFLPEAPDVVSPDFRDAIFEEHNDDLDCSRWRLVATLDEHISTAQTEVAEMDEPSALSGAQEVIACYRAVHGGDHAPECASTEIDENLSEVPEDQRSVYTIATSVDSQLTVDMMWKPKLKVHMRHADKMALLQAQNQAIAMMHNAGLKPTCRIQCRRRGCADILTGVEALKYHLHIHNIADVAAKGDNSSPPVAYESSLGQRNETSKKGHSRSLGTLQKCSTAYFSPRNLSTGSLLPSNISLRESIQHDAPHPTTVAKSFVSDYTRSKSANLCNNDQSCTHTPTSSRGRRARKESMTFSLGPDNPSITMLLSPPSPRVHIRPASAQHTNFPSPLTPHPTDGEANNRVVTPNGLARQVVEKSRSPLRALSPTRTMNHIQSIKRALSNK